MLIKKTINLNHLKIIGLLISLSLPLKVKANQYHPTEQVTILKVNNGQEVLVELKGEGRAIRLACIQAPLSEQKPWAKQAKDMLSKELKKGSEVEMELRSRDVYGRIVARLIQGKEDLGAKLIRRGKVFFYDGYLGDCQNLDYKRLEKQAKNLRRGVWSVENGIERPWNLIELSGKTREP